MVSPIISGRRFASVGAILMTVVPLMAPRDYAANAVQNLDEKAEPSWPMFGGSPSRNMVNAREQKLPVDWCVEEGKRQNVKWNADLGDRTFGSPVVAHGKIFVATNNAKPRDPNVKGRKAVLMAFRESDGQFLWQIAHDLPDLGLGPHGFAALPSTPAVGGGRLYYLTPACEVICADAENGKVHWRYDMMKELQVHPCPGYCLAPPLSSPLVIGNLVFVVTGNGVDGEDWKVVSPKAPSFIALDRRTGKLAWQSNLPGENIIEGQWSSPTFADPGGVPQVIFAGGDCVIYSFAPETGKLLWKCDCLPTRQQKGAGEIGKHGVDHYIVGTPVVLGNKLYVGLGHAPAHPRPVVRWSYFLCLDITKKGDVSLKSYDAKAALNKSSALVWAFGGPVEPRPEKGRPAYFGATLSTAAVHEGLVYITEEYGYLHCLDAATGRHAWEYDFKTSVLGSPFWADGRVFVGTEDGEVKTFAHGRTAKLLATIDMEDAIDTTPVAVNDTLYVTTWSKLFAIGSR
jgi:outer membrane protein assembly factor BamB